MAVVLLVLRPNWAPDDMSEAEAESPIITFSTASAAALTLAFGLGLNVAPSSGFV